MPSLPPADVPRQHAPTEKSAPSPAQPQSQSLESEVSTTSAAKAWHFYNHTLNSPTNFAAPMVDQSELAFRMMTRKYGAHVCVSPMIDAE